MRLKKEALIPDAYFNVKREKKHLLITLTPTVVQHHKPQPWLPPMPLT